jgi:hypothetical protein
MDRTRRAGYFGTPAPACFLDKDTMCRFQGKSRPRDPAENGTDYFFIVEGILKGAAA